MTNVATLEKLVLVLNSQLSLPEAAYDESFQPNPRNLHLDSAYGGWMLCQMGNNGSGTSNISDRLSVKQMEQFLRGAIAVNYGIKGGSGWDDNPKYPREDWQYEVANNDTVLGYIEWCQHKIEH